MFFARLPLVFGRSKCHALWKSAEDLQLVRREWAPLIGEFSLADLERALDKAKKHRVSGDPDFQWPDVAKLLSLAKQHAEVAAHRLAPRALPEPDWAREKRRESGARHMRALLHGLRTGDGLQSESEALEIVNQPRREDRTHGTV